MKSFEEIEAGIIASLEAYVYWTCLGFTWQEAHEEAIRRLSAYREAFVERWEPADRFLDGGQA